VPHPDKGDVVRNLLNEMGRDVPAAYLGDDSTDEPAFLAIRGCGLGVRVSPKRRKTAAQLWLKSADEVLHFLTQWLATCRGGDFGTSAKAGAVGG